jgi:hypothetical protein
MRKSTDLSLIIIAAALSFSYGSTFGQLGFVLTGIPATNFLFTIGHSILACAFLLIYEGRRWRYLFQTSLVILFSVVIIFAYGRALNLISILPYFIIAFLADILLNSLYGIFNKRNKLVF